MICSSLASEINSTGPALRRLAGRGSHRPLVAKGLKSNSAERTSGGICQGHQGIPPQPQGSGRWGGGLRLLRSPCAGCPTRPVSGGNVPRVGAVPSFPGRGRLTSHSPLQLTQPLDPRLSAPLFKLHAWPVCQDAASSPGCFLPILHQPKHLPSGRKNLGAGE